jgi:hypothetical protein
MKNGIITPISLFGDKKIVFQNKKKKLDNSKDLNLILANIKFKISKKVFIF